MASETSPAGAVAAAAPKRKFLWLEVTSVHEASRPSMAAVEVTKALVDQVTKLATLAAEHNLSEVRQYDHAANWVGVNQDTEESWRTELNEVVVLGGSGHGQDMNGADVNFTAVLKHGDLSFETSNFPVLRLQEIANDTSGQVDFIETDDSRVDFAIEIIRELVEHRTEHDFARARAEELAVRFELQDELEMALEEFGDWPDADEDDQGDDGTDCQAAVERPRG